MRRAYRAPTFWTLLLLAAGPSAALAQAKPTAAAASAEALRIAQQKLAQGSEEQIVQALAVLQAMRSDAAALAIGARLRRGLPPALTEAAIDALVLIARPVAAPAILELVAHRRAPIRVRAIRALAALSVRSAQSALLYALDDPSAEVRLASTEALGVLGTPRALPALLTAADRGVPEALVAVGRLARPSDLDALLGRARDGDVSALEPALTALMERATFPLAGKLSVITALAKLGSPSVRGLLVRWLDAHKQDGPAALRKALFQAIKRIDDGAKT